MPLFTGLSDPCNHEVSDFARSHLESNYAMTNQESINRRIEIGIYNTKSTGHRSSHAQIRRPFTENWKGSLSFPSLFIYFFMYIMSEGTSLLQNHAHRASVDRKMTLFQAQTTHFQINPALAMRCHESSPDAIPVMLRGSKTGKTTIGRGHDATIQIGRANKRVSREHVVIEHKPQMGGFELTILSPNGALVDRIVFVEGEHVPVMEGTTIEIVGTKIIFQVPDDSSNHTAEAEVMEDIIETPLRLAAATVDAQMEAEQETVQQDDNIPVMAMEQSTIASTTTITVTQNSSTHHTKSTLNSIIKSTASKLKETARNIMKRPMTMEDEIIQALGKVRHDESRHGS